jgi:biopolymer transport protein ExbB
MFLLDVIIAGAPLIGLLGTVTGLVQVFSQMPTGGNVDHSLFSQGISLALLTTMVGLAITLPTIFFNSYLQRVLDKRAASLDWLTARLIDATERKKPPADVIR